MPVPSRSLSTAPLIPTWQSPSPLTTPLPISRVKRGRFLYHLSDSMLVRSVFSGQMKTWFLHMDASSLCMLKHQEGPGQGFSTPLIDVQVQIPESLKAISCKQVNQTSGRLVGSAIQESMDSEDAPKLHIFSNDIGKLHEGDHLFVDIPDVSVNPDNQVLHAESAELENAKFVLSEQTIQHNSEGEALKASNMVGDPISDYKALISGQKRAIDFNNPQDCDTNMHPNVDTRCEELADNCHDFHDGAVSSAAAQSKSKKRNRDHCGPADDSALEGLLVPLPRNKKDRKKKQKKGCFIELDRPLKVDEAVNSFHTAEKSEFEKLAASNSEENCTPCEDLKREFTSVSDLVKVKRKKKSVLKGYEVDLGNLISHQEVVECQFSGKDSQTSLKETVDVTNLDNQNVISQDGKSKHSASEKMDEKGSKIFPLVEASGNSESATVRKRKKPKRTKYHEADAPLVNHNVVPDDGSPSVHDCQNIIDNNVDIADQLIGTKQVEKVNLSAETKQAGVQHTKSGSAMLTSMEGADNDVVPGKKIFGGEDGMVSKDGKKKKSKKAATAAVERHIVPQVGVALNILPLGLEHTELMHDRSTSNNEGGSKKKENNEAVSKKKENNNEASRKKKEKKLHGKIKNADSEASMSNSQLLSSSTRNEKCGRNEQGLSKMRTRTPGALTSMPSQERSRDSNMMSSCEATAEVNMYDDDDCSNSSDRVNRKEICCLQKDSLKFVDYFVPGSNNGKHVHPDESATLRKQTKKVHTKQNFSVPLNEADFLDKAYDHQRKKNNVGFAKLDISAPHNQILAIEREMQGDDFSNKKAPKTTLDTFARIHGASNGKMSSKGSDSEKESEAATDASLGNLSASAYSDQDLDSTGSETLSPGHGSDDLAHENGHLITATAIGSVGSIGRKMMQTKKSMTAGRLSDIFKSASSYKKAELQASKSKLEQLKVDDTDSPPVDAVMETQDSLILAYIDQ